MKTKFFPLLLAIILCIGALALPASATTVPEGAFTPDGTGTVLDTSSGKDGDKQFYTIKTSAGNVFYLIIDGKRSDNNVYFLDGVTETDLLALAQKGGGSVSAIPDKTKCTCGEKCEAGKVNADCQLCKNDLTGCIVKAATAAQDSSTQKPEKEEKGVNAGLIIFVVLAFVAVGGAGYYFKIVRPKQQAALDDEGEEYEDDGYGEGINPNDDYSPDDEYLSEDIDDEPEKGGE